MILKSYLANVKIWKGSHFETVQKRVVPILSCIQVKVENLNSGVRGEYINLPDTQKTTEFVVSYVDINDCGEMINSVYGFQLNTVYALKTYPQNYVEIIPNTEEDFEPIRTETSWAEDRLQINKEEMKKKGLKRYGLRSKNEKQEKNSK